MIPTHTCRRSVGALLAEARAAGLLLMVEGGRLLVSGPRGVVERFRPLLAPHRKRLIAAVTGGTFYLPGDPDPLRDGLRAGFWAHAAATPEGPEPWSQCRHLA